MRGGPPRCALERLFVSRACLLLLAAYLPVERASRERRAACWLDRPGTGKTLLGAPCADACCCYKAIHSLLINHCAVCCAAILSRVRLTGIFQRCAKLTCS